MLKLTQVTTRKPRRLSKHFEIRQGKLTREQGGKMTEGTCAVREFVDMTEFATFLNKLRPNEALIYGVPNDMETAEIVLKKTYDKLSETERVGKVSRSKECFRWPDSPGIFMIDYDPENDANVLKKTELLALLHKVIPEFKDVSKVWWPSSSSHICRTDGTDLTGLRGQRVYIPISDARKIPELSDAIKTRFWAGGYGRVHISRSGKCLKRTPIDHSVYQPNRLDFAAGASTGIGLEQRRGQPEVIS